ncbi:MAG: alpha-galactosidase [Microthrixaceae bacterium]
MSTTPQTSDLSGQLIRVDAGGWGLTWVVDSMGVLRQVGLGPNGHMADCDVEPIWYPTAFPTWGGPDVYRPAALRVTHADGTMSTRLVVESIERTALDSPDNHKPEDPDTDRDRLDGGEHIVVRCRDEIFGLTVEHHLKTHPASGVLEQWLQIEHSESGPVRLSDYDSIAPFMLVPEAANLCQFGGSGWADEWRWSTQTLTTGTTSLTSLGGIQPHLQRSPTLLLSPTGLSEENDGEVLGMSIAWGGNIRFDLDVRPTAQPGAPRELRIRAGANPYGAEYTLDPDTKFTTPTVAWTWSTTGRGAVTRSFHEWTRARVLRDPQRLRPLVVNNWEATFFDFDEARIVDLIDRSAELGADVFLLDDGWFGVEHPRNDDTTSLGDWDPDPVKLPDGLAPLAAAAADAGIRFGIWVEPEMVNRVSNLYEEHPDWVIRDQREPREHRNQLALDPLLEQVRDFELGVVDRTLASAPGTSYMKWDANRPVTDYGSSALAADRQSNLWVDQVLATWDVMSEVAVRHPDVEMMLCASGGGRTDHGTLRWFHDFWTSDNTDPVTRVRMQWACSHFFPAATMAAHVTRWGERPMGFACAVALSGRFGFDLDLVSLTNVELAICREAVAIARRTQDVVQMGDLHRLISPVEGADTSRAALAYRSASTGRPSADRTVAFAYQLEDSSGAGPTLHLPWLDADLTYRITATDLDKPATGGDRGGAVTSERAGDDLIESGLSWPSDEPLTATIWEIQAV